MPRFKRSIAAACGAVLLLGCFAEVQANQGALPPPKLVLSREFVSIAAGVQKSWNAAKARPDVQARKAELDALYTAIPAKAAPNSLTPERIRFQAKQQELASLVSAEGDAIESLLAKAGNNDERYFSASMLIDLGKLTREYPRLQRGLTLALETGRVPSAQVPAFKLVLADIAYSEMNLVQARNYYKELMTAGYFENDIDFRLAESYFMESPDKNVLEGLKVLLFYSERAKALGKSLSVLAMRRGLAKSYEIRDSLLASYFGAEAVRLEPTKTNWTGAVAVLRISLDAERADRQTMIDLARLADRTGSLAEARDFMESASVYMAAALPKELQGVTEAGIAAGLLKPGDPFVRDARQRARQQLDQDASSNALEQLSLDARKPGAPTTKIVMAGSVALSYGRPDLAEELYRMAEGRSDASMDLVNVRLGIAQFDQGKFAEAQASFAKAESAGSPLARLWGALAANRLKGR